MKSKYLELKCYNQIMIEKIKKNKIAVLLGGLVLVVGLYFVFTNSNLLNTSTTDTESPTITSEPEQAVEPGNDPLNATYSIDGQNINLVNGINEEQIPNSSTNISTKNFSEPIYGELNESINDSGEDATFILVQDPGGSGTFYYVVASISTDEGYLGTNGILLGDRIAPQTQEILEDGNIVVNYAERAGGESMAEEPTGAVSRYFKVEGSELIEVENPNN